MDEQDIAERSEDQSLETNQTFAGLGKYSPGVTARDLVSDLFRSRTKTIGLKLLHKMGWKQGQRVGPRMQSDTQASSEDMSRAQLVSSRQKPIQFIQKDDRMGLGCNKRLSKQHCSDKTNTAANAYRESGKLLSESGHSRKSPMTMAGPRAGGAFGVGVLNDDGSDDDDPFSMGPKIALSRPITTTKRSKKLAAKESMGAKSNPKARVAQPSRSFQRCHDGVLPITGFVLAEPLLISCSTDREEYAPPRIPEDWVSSRAGPNAHAVSLVYPSNFDAVKTLNTDAKARGSILGEKQLPGKSVFDFLTPAARDRLVAASKNKNLPPGRGELDPRNLESGPSITKQNRDEAEIPFLDKRTAQTAIEKGAPFGMSTDTDEARPLLYATFLEYSAGLQLQPPQRPASMSTSQWLDSLNKFVKIAKAAKPVSSLMASRFSSAGVSKPSDESLKQLSCSAKPSKPGDPAEEAAAAGIFGSVTRSYHQFYPARVACKRFNVKLPSHVDAESKGRPAAILPRGQNTSLERHTVELVSSEAMEEMKKEARLPFMDTAVSSETIDNVNEAEHGTRPVSEEVAAVDASRNEAIERQKAGEAVYRAIFGEDKNRDSDE